MREVQGARSSKGASRTWSSWLPLSSVLYISDVSQFWRFLKISGNVFTNIQASNFCIIRTPKKDEIVSLIKKSDVSDVIVVVLMCSYPCVVLEAVKYPSYDLN